MMQLTILDEQRVRLAADGDGLNVVGDHFGPLQMLATSLALCTASVVHAYAETAQLDLNGLAVEVAWEFSDDPHRVGAYDLTLHVPATIPPARHRALIRAADTCTVHNTLQHSPQMTTQVAVFDPSASDDHPHHVHQA